MIIGSVINVGEKIESLKRKFIMFKKVEHNWLKSVKMELFRNQERRNSQICSIIILQKI